MPMRVKLYLDVFFLINTGMNLVVFLTQSLLMQKPFGCGALSLRQY